jgi:predicted nucleic acid-binding protein
MIIVDTNTFSEPTNPRPDPNVLAWFGQQDFDNLYYTTTNLAETYVGIESLPNGRRKAALEVGTQELLRMFFGPRILPFDEAAAKVYGPLVARLIAKGEKPGFGDGQIAAIAHLHGFAVATRDTNPFLAAGLKVINPWEAV